MALKRIFDVFFSAFALLLTLPIFISAALLIKIQDGGPIFFRQERVGLRGKVFQIFKFRTMTNDPFRSGPEITKRGDSRITPIGRFLRKTKIDELPQLLNVLLGDMSFVGPRPEVLRYVSLYDDNLRRVLSFKPGLTDLATLTFIDEEELLSKTSDPEKLYVETIMPRKIWLNLEYQEKASFWTDLGIIAKTVLRIIFRERTKVLPPVQDQ